MSDHADMIRRAVEGTLEDPRGEVATALDALLAERHQLQEEVEVWRMRWKGCDRKAAYLFDERQQAIDALEVLTSVPLTWHPRGEAEQASFDATLRAYQLALRLVKQP